ncbi:MAG: restriction endonuclease subunit [Ignavibacteriaceae bacterium]|nr:restriction endonuclease subunit [Ignavibacteriaceae bacterium]
MEIINKTIGEIETLIKTGKTPPSKEERYYNGSINWYTPGDLDKQKFLGKSNRTITAEAIEENKATILPKYTVVIGAIGDIGKLGITSVESCTNQQITGIRTNDEVYFEYFYYWLKANKQLLRSNAKNAILPILNNESIRSIKIQFPKNINDQKRIAKVLSQCEDLIQKRKKSIDLLNDLMKSKFIEMFGAPETNHFGWEEKVFGDYTEYIGDIGSNGSNDTVSKNLVMSDIEDYAIMIRTTNLNANDFTKNLKYISKETYEFFSKSKIYGGEIIMNKIGSPGKFWVMPNLERPVSLGLNQFVIRLKDLNTNYIKYFLSTNFGEVNIQSRTQGATTKSITKSAVRSLPILYPPMELQIEFSELVDKVEAVINKFNESLKELENLYGSISQRAFNGDLDLSKVDILDMEDSKKKELEEVKEDFTEEQVEDLIKSFEHTLPTGEVPSNRETDIRKMSIRQYLRLSHDEATEGIEFSYIDKDFFYQFILTKGFPDRTFTLPELQQYARKYILRGTGFEFTYENWKTIIFRFIGAKQPIIEQVFDEDDKIIKLKLTNEAFKV